MDRTIEPQPVQQPITCPMECSVCSDPGDCEDCLDCLYWPNVVEEEPPSPPAPRGRCLPTKTAEMVAARRSLLTSKRVGLVSRRYRRLARLSQRALARELGWSRASVGRIEKDASAMTLEKVETLMQHTGYRLAIVAGSSAAEGESSDDQWTAGDLIARDRAGRRPSPLGEARWHPAEDLREDSSLRGREWTWHRPSG